MFCSGTKDAHHQEIAHHGKCRVHFVKTKKRFDNIREAEHFLNHLRWTYSSGKYDPRDFSRSNPLSFSKLAEKWIEQKSKEEIDPSTLCNHKTNIQRAVNHFADLNIKEISEGEIEDFLFADHRNLRNGEPIRGKTRSEIRSTLHHFFVWVCRREKLPMPEIPTIKHELGWRNVIDLDTQQRVLDEIWRISGHINPRFWLGISLLSHNSNVRPGELIKVAEGDVLIDYGLIMVKYPKEGSLKSGKQAYLFDDEIELIKSLPHALPEVPLFRHTFGQSGVTPGQRFSGKIFNNWWKRACKNLGIDAVTVYPGTKHSTMTAVSKELSPEQIRRGGSGHLSKAMERYIIPNKEESERYQSTIQQLRNKNRTEVIDFEKNREKK